MPSQASQLLTGALLLAVPAVSQVTIEPVILTGDPAPLPTYGPAVFTAASGFDDFSINERGDLALNLNILRSNPPFAYYPIVFGNGLWVRKDGVISYVAASGELLPNDTSGEVLGLQDVAAFNRAGDVVIAAAEATNINQFAFVGSGASLYFGNEVGLTQIASKENPSLSPELPAGTIYAGWGIPADIEFRGNVRLSESGRLAYVGLLEGPAVDDSNNEILLTGTSAASSVLVREGDTAFGYPAGVVIGCPSCGPANTFGNPRLNARGDVFVQARVTGAGIGAIDDRVIYGFVGGNQILVARAVDSAPSQDRVRFVTDPETNDQGLVLFRGTFGPLAGPTESLFYGPPTGVLPVVQAGDAAPGLPGLTIEALFDDSASPIRLPIAPPIMNARGEVVFAANVDGPGVSAETERALFFGAPGSETAIVRAGDVPSDLPGSRFLSIGRFTTNANGLVVFQALTAPLGTFNARVSLWAWEPGLTEPFLVARQRGQLPFGASTKTAINVSFRGGAGMQGGFGSQLNDSGVLLFSGEFADGTFGLYETDLSDTDEGIGTRYCSPAVANSTGRAATLRVNGSDVATDNDVTLTALDLPPGSFGFFLTSTQQASTANPGGSQGVLCLGGSIGRYFGPGQVKNSGVLGEFSLDLDLTRTPTPTGLVSVQAGETWNFQAWHRDSVGGAITSNFTDAVGVTFQ